MDRENTLIVGAGPIGLACAISAKRRGIDPLVIDSGAIVNSILHYPVGMAFFTTPELLEIGGHPFPCAAEKPTREEALMYYRGVVRSEGIRVQTFTRLLTAEPTDGAIRCELDTDFTRQHPSRGSLIAGTGERKELVVERLVLATGYYDNPNLLGVPGEHLPHVRHYFDEAHPCSGLNVVVVGGRNSAIEAVLLLFRAGARTTLVYRGDHFVNSVKYWIKPDIENRIKAGEIDARLGAEVIRFEPGTVTIRTADGREEVLPADRVYVLTGFHPDFDLFRQIGIELDPETLAASVDERTLETNVSGVYLAGSVSAGHATSNIFIENGRFDGEKIFGS
jgi:thioredoxin reductase (NADPH)